MHLPKWRLEKRTSLGKRDRVETKQTEKWYKKEKKCAHIYVTNKYMMRSARFAIKFLNSLSKLMFSAPRQRAVTDMVGHLITLQEWFQVKKYVLC